MSKALNLVYMRFNKYYLTKWFAVLSRPCSQLSYLTQNVHKYDSFMDKLFGMQSLHNLLYVIRYYSMHTIVY